MNPTGPTGDLRPTALQSRNPDPTRSDDHEADQ
jgi:hypothetical protein